ncbi:MAG: SDR family NAD(P)-dependent oxidoreductase [Acutalibacteraceae bacterium]
MGRFTNKTVIITGGARGIGYGIATAFAKEGANLVLTSIVQEELDNAKQTLEEEGVKMFALYADGEIIPKYRLQ